jgi:2,4-dienoyl-CoA reductase-like NADH-dependent reductase (Old Yellow Enzyme family)
MTGTAETREAQRTRLLAEISRQVKELPAEARLDPTDLAEKSAISPGETIAILQILKEEGLGELRLMVMEPGSKTKEVQSYKNLYEIPPTLKDAEGKTFNVGPENVHLMFVPTQGLPAKKTKQSVLRRILGR